MLVTAIMRVARSKFALHIAVACAPLPAAAGQAAVSGDFAGLIDIGRGRKMYLECRGTGSPTVALVAGLKASAGDWNIAKPSEPTVFAAVAKCLRPSRNAGRREAEPQRPGGAANDGGRRGLQPACAAGCPLG